MKVRAKDNILIGGRHVAMGAKIDITDAQYAKCKEVVEIVTAGKVTVKPKKPEPLVFIPESAKEVKETKKSERFKKSY